MLRIVGTPLGFDFSLENTPVFFVYYTCSQKKSRGSPGGGMSLSQDSDAQLLCKASRCSGAPLGRCFGMRVLRMQKQRGQLVVRQARNGPPSNRINSRPSTNHDDFQCGSSPGHTNTACRPLAARSGRFCKPSWEPPNRGGSPDRPEASTKRNETGATEG